MSENDIEAAIYERAAEDGQFAIAYGLLKCAEALDAVANSVEGAGDRAGDIAEAITHAADSPSPVAKLKPEASE